MAKIAEAHWDTRVCRRTRAAFLAFFVWTMWTQRTHGLETLGAQGVILRNADTAGALGDTRVRMSKSSVHGAKLAFAVRGKRRMAVCDGLTALSFWRVWNSVAAPGRSLESRGVDESAPGRACFGRAACRPIGRTKEKIRPPSRAALAVSLLFSTWAGLRGEVHTWGGFSGRTSPLSGVALRG